MWFEHSLLSASEEAEAAGAAGAGRPIFGRVVGGSVIIVGLYLSRLRNPLYTSIIGETETKESETLRDECASHPIYAFFALTCL